MIITNEHTIVDNDFLGKILEINFDEQEKTRIIKQVFLNLGKRPIVHALVYNNEMLDKHKNAQVFVQGVVEIAKKDDILQGNSTLEEYYRKTFEDLYFELTGASVYDNYFTNIWEHWTKQKNLGEVHSITTCCVCECDLFLSDDDDSKILSSVVENLHNITIRVWTRDEMLQIIEKQGLNKKVRSALGHR